MDDLLFEFTEWLRGTPVTELSLWISDTRASEWIAMHFWAIPIFQVIHILSISASVAAVLMLNLRVFGFAGHATLAESAHRYSRVLWWALLGLICSGFLMIVGEPVRELVNPYFWVKMILLVIGVTVAVLFAKALGRQGATSDVAGGGTKAVALLLVVLWCMIIWCGRWIAYAPV
ncbi:MAG TPA: DUF6644 family protein [Croceibacterium sp.]|nr:DUF6644 family protein [Croceibacterium sp.]